MPGIFYDNPATLDGLNLAWTAWVGDHICEQQQISGPESKTGKLSLSRGRVHRSALFGIQWGASMPISSLACYPIPCLVSSPLYFIVLLLLSSSVVFLSYCFRYCYSISVVIICCCYVFYVQFLIVYCCYSFVSIFLLSIVVIFNFVTLFIICCCY